MGARYVEIFEGTIAANVSVTGDVLSAALEGPHAELLLRMALSFVFASLLCGDDAAVSAVWTLVDECNTLLDHIQVQRLH